jgi:hypothetical protein
MVLLLFQGRPITLRLFFPKKLEEGYPVGQKISSELL